MRATAPRPPLLPIQQGRPRGRWGCPQLGVPLPAPAADVAAVTKTQKGANENVAEVVEGALLLPLDDTVSSLLN